MSGSGGGKRPAVAAEREKDGDMLERAGRETEAGRLDMRGARLEHTCRHHSVAASLTWYCLLASLFQGFFIFRI